MKKIIKSKDEMRAFAAGIARGLKAGDILGLTGELGAGKTTFVQGLGKALGIKQPITSPTFLLFKLYDIRKKDIPFVHLIHVDAYRVESAQELLDAGIVEYMNQVGAVTVVEWADKVKKILPKGRVTWIKFKLGKKPEERIVEVTGKKK